jgi:hypothetical protein
LRHPLCHQRDNTGRPNAVANNLLRSAHSSQPGFRRVYWTSNGLMSLSPPTNIPASGSPCRAMRAARRYVDVA